MAEFALGASIIGMVGFALSLSQQLYQVYKNRQMVGKEFKVFGDEVAAFADLWSAARPSLEASQPHVSAELERVLQRICRGTSDILVDLTESVVGFKNWDEDQRRKTLSWCKRLFISPERIDGSSRVRIFMDRPDIALQRGQLEHVKTNLLLIIEVINYSKSNLASSTYNPSLSRAEHLIEAQQRSSKRIRRKENRDPDLHHQASKWLNIDKVVQSAIRQSPSTISTTETIDILVARWTTPRPPAQYLGPNTNAPVAAYCEVQPRRSPEIRDLRAVNADLTAQIVEKDRIIHKLKFPPVQYFQDLAEQRLREIEDLLRHNRRLYGNVKVTEADYKKLQIDKQKSEEMIDHLQKENKDHWDTIIQQQAEYSDLLARYNSLKAVNQERIRIQSLAKDRLIA